MTITKEEFLADIKGMAEDTKDPDGDFHALRMEFQEMIEQVRPHDAELVLRIEDVVAAFDRLGEYVVARAES